MDLTQGSSDPVGRTEIPLAGAQPPKPTPNPIFPAEAILDPFGDVPEGANLGKIGKMCKVSDLSDFRSEAGCRGRTHANSG